MTVNKGLTVIINHIYYQDDLSFSQETSQASSMSEGRSIHSGSVYIPSSQSQTYTDSESQSSSQEQGICQNSE